MTFDGMHSGHPVLVEEIFRTAAKSPLKPAIICGDESVSYSTLKHKISTAAAFLKERGVRRGDRVVLSATNSNPHFVYGYFACHLLGAISIPVDPKIPKLALEKIVQQTEPRVVFVGDMQNGEGAFLPLGPLNREGKEEESITACDLDETVDILFTAGTTGKPKGVMQSYRNILSFAKNRNAVVGAAVDDRILIPVPLSHGFGLGRLRATMLSGSTVILVSGFMFPAHIFSAFERYKANGLCCVPTGFAVLFQLSGDKLSEYADQIKYIETATAPLSDEMKRRLLKMFPKTRIYNSYGATETTSSIAFSELHSLEAKLDSVGKPVDGVETRIADGDRKELAPGAVGQVLVRGESVMKGYWRDPERTQSAIVDGWLGMNDIGFVDQDKHLFLVGRKEDLINLGGLKVAPMEIETALREHAAIKECACTGIADPSGLTGEIAIAFLVAKPEAPTPGDDELIAFLRSRLEPFKIPTRFQWVSDLPKSPMGKIDRKRLKTL